MKFLEPFIIILKAFVFCIQTSWIALPDTYKRIKKQKFWTMLLYIVMITRVFSGTFKENGEELYAAHIKDKTFYSLIVTFILVAIFGIIDYLTGVSALGYVLNINILWLPILILSVLLLWRSISRILEIFYAFYNDAHTHLSPRKRGNSSSLKYYERIHLALYSYAELILLYALVFYIFSGISVIPEICYPVFNNGDGTVILDMIDAVYFSGVTITTLGYGDIQPSVALTKFLSVFEVLSGFALIIISFTVYVSRAIREMDIEENTKGEQNV